MLLYILAARGSCHGQPRQKRPREEKAEENGSQADIHTGKTNNSVQTYDATTGANIGAELLALNREHESNCLRMVKLRLALGRQR